VFEAIEDRLRVPFMPTGLEFCPFGDGDASLKIVKFLDGEYLGQA